MTCMLVCCVVLAVCGAMLSGVRRSMACATGSAGKSSGSSSNAAAAIEQGLTEGLAAQESLLHQVHPSARLPLPPLRARCHLSFDLLQLHCTNSIVGVPLDGASRW